MAGEKVQYLTPLDVDIIKRCVVCAAASLPGVTIEDDGASVVLPGSLGVADAKC